MQEKKQKSLKKFNTIGHGGKNGKLAGKIQ